MSDDEQTISLSLEQVRERFEESTRVLVSARERLDALSESAEIQENLSRGLQETSTQVFEFTSAAREAAEGLKEAQNKVSESFDALKQLIEESDLKAVREGIDRISERLDRISELEAELSSTKEKLASVQADFERLKGSVGPRALKKAGFV